MQSRNLTLLWLLPLAALLAVYICRAVNYPLSDYAGYYFGGRALLEGHYQGAYDMELLNRSIAAQGYRDVWVSYAPFPPFTSLVFAPFLPLKIGVSKVWFNIFSALLFLITLYRCCRYLSIRPYFLLALPVVFYIPVINNLFFGQSYLLLSFLLLEGWLAYRKGQDVLSSFLWGVAILFKLFPGVLLIFLLLRKKYRSFLYLSLACGLLFALSLWLNGVAVWKYYLGQAVPKMNAGELNDSWTYIFQSAFMLLKRVFLYDALLNPHPLWQNPWLFVASMAVFKAALLTAAIVITLRKKDDFISFAVWIAVSMLISPNGSSYSLVLLAIPLLAVWASVPASTGKAPESRAGVHSEDQAGPERRQWLRILAATLLLWAACMVSVQRFGSWPVPGQFPRLWLLLLFFACLLWQQDFITRKISDWLLLPALAALFFILDIGRWLPEKNESSYLLSKEEHLFIYDYTVRDNRLVYYSRDGTGQRETPTDFPASAMSDSGIELRDNQIWFKGSQITNSADHKEKARLIDGKYIVYLSDKNRGIGFYTLRKIPLSNR